MKTSASKTPRRAVITNELAHMIADGFAQTASKDDLRKLEVRVGGVEGRLGRVETRLDKIEDRLRTVETKLDRALYTELTALDSRVRRLEEKAGFRR